MTRLEISCHHEALKNYIFADSSIKNFWHSRMQSAVDHLVDKWLNYPHIIKDVYKKLSLTELITRLSRCRVNLLIVGRSKSWIVNATTGHPKHFVGTMRNFGLTHCANSEFAWGRIKEFV